MKIFRLFLIAGITLLSQFTFSQYYYTTASGNTPGGLNQDQTLVSPQNFGWTVLLGPSVTTPTWSAIQTIPFPFNFNGAPVTTYKVSSTGVLTFSTGATIVPGSTPAALPDATVPDNSICIWGIEANGSNDRVSTKTFGSPGGQQEWIHFSSCSNGNINFSYWSIVLEEGTDRIYIVDQYNWGAGGALSVGIQIDNSTAYSDPASPAVTVQALGGIDGTSTIDDHYYTFIQGVQPVNDVELVSLDLSPYVAPGSVDIKGSILNTGIDPISALAVTWNDGTGPYIDNISGLNIPSNGTYDFTSPTALNATGGNSYTIDVNVTVIGDGDSTNNDLTASTFALDSIPTKYVVGEEKTGTWCGYCPRGAVGLANMESVSNFIGIAVHNNDPMTVSSYDDEIGNYIPGGFPEGGVDRVEIGDPTAANLLTMYNNRIGAIIPCDVKNITANYNSGSNEITVSAESEWYGTISGDYRFSCVIVEDDIIETGTDWLQVNYYSGGTNGIMAFPAGINNGFDFSTAPDPADPALFGGYDHVARSLSNDDILGDVGSLPVGLVPEGVHSYTFAPVSASLFSNLNKCHAIVMIINTTTGEIINAYKTNITGGGVGLVELENNLELKLFPNPAADQVSVSVNLQSASDATLTVTDALGNIVISSGITPFKEGTNFVAINASVLSNGFYFVNFMTDSQTVTERFSVVH